MRLRSGAGAITMGFQPAVIEAMSSEELCNLFYYGRMTERLKVAVLKTVDG